MDIRTDLAVEAASMCGENILGLESEITEEKGVKVERIRIKTKEASDEIGKPVGNYITITVDDLSDNDKEDYEKICLQLAKELKEILNLSEKDPVLTVGLGNEGITADSIGPKCVKKLLVTRHIKEIMPEEIDESVRSVSAISPSVMALTGIETGDIIKGVTKMINPALVIAIDALAARSMSRLGRTIQIADTGINPGSGVGNNRKELSKDTLGVRVIAIGVPMVVDAKTIVYDSIELTGKSEEDYHEIYRRLDNTRTDMVVTPKDVDSLSERCARIIANGINLALQSALDENDIDRYIEI